MPQCYVCKTEFEDLFVMEDGSKLCARCLEMEANKKPDDEPAQVVIVLDRDED